MDRRKFIINSGIVSLGFLGIQKWAFSQKVNTSFSFYNYGVLEKDPLGIVDLPKGFSYKIISQVGELMDDGFYLPGKPDGMACFPLDKDRCIVVRNHELNAIQFEKEGPFGPENRLLNKIDSSKIYDFGKGKLPSIGGTTNFVFNMKEVKIEKQFLSLIGTNRNCAGGATPWNTWLSCEEDVTIIKGGEDTVEKNHGYIFEVPASEKQELTTPIPLKAMGRFNHEAVCVDPNTGVVYLTEDTHDSCIYRFIPNIKGDLSKGGKLQALMIKDQAKFDTRNWEGNSMPINHEYAVEWLNLDNVDPEEDDLRFRAYEQGAALFARGEGIWFGDNEFYFACTSGGKEKNGQIFRYEVSRLEAQADETNLPSKLSLFIQADNHDLMSYCDNLTIAPWGDVIVCEDNRSPRILGISKSGSLYPIAHNVGHLSEFTGACFTPDGSTLLVNIQDAGLTVAITGPWI